MARPKKEDAIDIKGRAIDESLALLRDTPDRLSLSVLARRIGCSAPALYAHFRGKDDLLEQVRERAVRDLVGAGTIRIDTAAEAPGTAPIERIRDGGRRLARLANETPAIYRLIFAPDHDTSASQLDAGDITIRPIARNLREAMADAGASGIAPDALAQMVWFTLHGALMMALDRQLRGPQDRRWDRAIQSLDDVLGLVDGRNADGYRTAPQRGSPVGGHM